MLVYGDPRFETTSTEFLNDLVRDGAYPDPPGLEWLRTLLIRAGQLEQALEDTKEHSIRTRAALVQTRRLTDAAAAVFLDAVFGKDTRRDWDRFRRQLLRCARMQPELGVTVKVPEGFEYYTLFPEAYAQSAQEWARQRFEAAAKRVLVVGLRSIGTSLSAVVAVVLRQHGWRVARRTVRPQGHPFDRKSDVGRSVVGSYAAALVVDEGPGMSGSSMASVFDWLRKHGLRDVSFFPGHDGFPGSAASQKIRELWNEVPKFVTSWEQTITGGRSIVETLKEITRAKCAEVVGTGPLSVEDLGGGRWRKRAFSETGDWPSFAAPFERVKLLIRGDTGPGVLWKFTGLGSRRRPEDGVMRNSRMAPEPFTPRVMAGALGFTATEWIEGQRLTPEDGKSPEVLRMLSDYLVWSAQDHISDTEHRQGVRRLEEMAWWNIREALGEDAASNVRPWSAAAMESRPSRGYGDGRMAPHEWVRTASGRILKTGISGLAGDHTLVGVQSFAWDLAGLMVEWQMDEPRQRSVYEAIRPAGLDVPEDALRFYVLAYLAFRIGMLRLVTDRADSEEQARIAMESAYYCHVLRSL